MLSQIVHWSVLEWHPFSLKVLILSNFQAFEESFQKLPQTTHRLVVQSSGSRTERPGTLVLWQNSQCSTPGGWRSQLGSNWRTYNDSGEQNNTRPTIIQSKSSQQRASRQSSAAGSDSVISSRGSSSATIGEARQTHKHTESRRVVNQIWATLSEIK